MKSLEVMETMLLAVCGLCVLVLPFIRFRWGDRLFTFLGCCLLVIMLGGQAQGFGKRWVLGRYYMPRSLVAADGVHYQDGNKIQEVTLALIRSGREEVWNFRTYCGLFLIFAWRLNHGRKFLLAEYRQKLVAAGLPADFKPPLSWGIQYRFPVMLGIWRGLWPGPKRKVNRDGIRWMD